MKKINTCGAEIEKAIASLKNQSSATVSQNFFKRLFELAKKRSLNPHYHYSDIKPDVILGVVTEELGEQGLDQAFNLLETSTSVQKSLSDLHKILKQDFKLIQKELLKEGATIVNLSIHPLANRKLSTYKKVVAPKGVYPYIRYRGWDHSAGIDARAQNSPSTGVTVENAADAVSIIIGAGAALIALFGNSPFEEGKRSKYKESRLTMWNRMLKNSKVKGDFITSQFPKKRFKNLAQYFNWMFGKGTGIHFVLAEGGNSQDYKGIGDRILILENNPPLLDYFEKGKWKAFYFKDLQKNPKTAKKAVTVTANISQMEVMQFAQFAGARIRYKLKNHQNFPLQEFIKACSQTDQKKAEEIFQNFTEFVYIEGRDPGANFPDQEIINAGRNIADSVLIAPSAIQAGLINNLEEAVKYIDSFNWTDLKKLRDSSLKDGLQGSAGKIKVLEFTKKILELASKGLSKDEQKYLAYPYWVLNQRKNGADRAIEFVNEKSKKTKLENTLKELIKYREAKIYAD